MTTKTSSAVAFYLRSASGNTDNLNRQKKLLQIFIKLRDELADSPIEIYNDEIQSGLKPGPQFLRMCQNIKEGKIDVVMVSELDRISRSSTEIFNFKDFVKTEGFRFISIRDGMDSYNWIYMDKWQTQKTNGELKIGSI